MKVTKSYIKQLIKEELSLVLEMSAEDTSGDKEVEVKGKKYLVGKHEGDTVVFTKNEKRGTWEYKSKHKDKSVDEVIKDLKEG